MTGTLIPADNGFALWAVLFFAAAVGFLLEKTPFGRRLSGPIVVIIIAAALSNVGVIPKSAEPYDAVWSYGVPVAVVLMLLRADLKMIIRESGQTLGAFMVAAAGTIIGTLVGVQLVLSGPETGALAAVFSATYIGGSLNFAAVAETIGFRDGTLLTASLAADNVVGTLYLALLMALPGAAFITRLFPASQPVVDATAVAGETKQAASPAPQPAGFSVGWLALALGLAFLIVAVSKAFAALMGYATATLLVATVLTVSIATIFEKQTAVLREAFPVGMLIMYLFFGIIGASVDLAAMVDSGLTVAAFAAIILSVQLAFLLTIGRLFKFGLPELLVASNACVVGPPAAAAMAAANKWHALITPGILCGTLGYVIANFIGLTLYAVL